MSDKTLGMLLGPLSDRSGMTTLVGRPDYAGPKLFGFHLRRANPKKGRVRNIEVWLWFGRSGVNLSADRIAPPLQEWKDAHNWACDFAETHGFEAMQRAPKKKQRQPPKLTLVPGGAP